MRIACSLMIVVACGPSGEPGPEPLEVLSVGDERSEPAHVPEPSFGGDATAWIASIRDTAVNVMMGGEPPTTLPIVGTAGEAPWVQSHDGNPLPTSVEGVLVFFEGTVTLSDGNRAEVVVLFIDAGPRLARIDARPTRNDPHPPLDPFLEPMAELTRSILADFRIGEGAQHIVTLEELQVLNRPDLLARVQSRLPDADDLAAIQQVIQQPGVELAHIDPDKIGVLMRDSNGALYGVDLRFRADNDGTYRFAGPPLLHVRRLPDAP